MCEAAHSQTPLRNVSANFAIHRTDHDVERNNEVSAAWVLRLALFLTISTLTVSSQTDSQIKESIDYSRFKNFKLPDKYLKTKTSNTLPLAAGHGNLPEAKMRPSLAYWIQVQVLFPSVNYSKLPRKQIQAGLHHTPSVSCLCRAAEDSVLILDSINPMVKCENGTKDAVEFQIISKNLPRGTNALTDLSFSFRGDRSVTQAPFVVHNLAKWNKHCSGLFHHSYYTQHCSDIKGSSDKRPSMPVYNRNEWVMPGYRWHSKPSGWVRLHQTHLFCLEKM